MLIDDELIVLLFGMGKFGYDVFVIVCVLVE